MSAKIWSFSAVGRDRPGIVAAISKLLFEHDCNLSDSSMTILAGQFAVVQILELGQKTDTDKLASAIDSLGEEWHLQVKVGPVDEDTEAFQHSGASLLVSVYGSDQAGITWKVADCLAKNGYNVTDLSTKKIDGSAPVYILLLEVEATPDSAPESELSQSLQKLGKELGCSVTLKPVESSEL